MKILFVSAECAPFAKRGGLGDVIGSLPKALHQLGHDVRVVIPAYQAIERGYKGVTPTSHILTVPLRDTAVTAGVFEGRLPNSDVPIYFIAEQNLFNRPEIYGASDDAYRFAFLSRAVFELMLALDWRPDILHAHDWHTAPAVMWLATAGQTDERFRGIGSIFTIHNLAHQGVTKWDVVDYLRIWTHRLLEERYGYVNFMARGIYHADIVTTVSPTYAKEILTEDGGGRLQNLLLYRRNALAGIVNGIDYDEWNPKGDPRLPHHFDADSLDDRILVRRALQQRAGLPMRDDVPLLGLVSRLDWQKGLDITGEMLHRLLNGMAGEAQFVVLGSGAPEFEKMFRQFERAFPHKMSARLAYDADLAPVIYGGCDMFLMPSRFEPCGLSQMISMRYGCVPIVRATGGLVDTVEDGRTGFVFRDYHAAAFWNAVARAIHLFNGDKLRWRKMQLAGMAEDWSWGRSAESYTAIYQHILQSS